MPTATYPWERPLGAQPTKPGRTGFRVWAPRAQRVALELDGRERGLEDAGYGVYEAEVDAPAGARYRFVVDGTPLPDPASRSQPEGLRGPSAVVDPAAVAWRDDGWQPPAPRGGGPYAPPRRPVPAGGPCEGPTGHRPGRRR